MLRLELCEKEGFEFFKGEQNKIVTLKIDHYQISNITSQFSKIYESGTSIYFEQ